MDGLEGGIVGLYGHAGGEGEVVGAGREGGRG